MCRVIIPAAPPWLMLIALVAVLGNLITLGPPLWKRRAHNAKILLQPPARIWGGNGRGSAHADPLPPSVTQTMSRAQQLTGHIRNSTTTLGSMCMEWSSPRYPHGCSLGFLLECCFLRVTLPDLISYLHPSYSDSLAKLHLVHYTDHTPWHHIIDLVLYCPSPPLGYKLHKEGMQ